MNKKNIIFSLLFFGMAIINPATASRPQKEEHPLIKQCKILLSKPEDICDSSIDEIFSKVDKSCLLVCDPDSMLNLLGYAIRMRSSKWVAVLVELGFQSVYPYGYMRRIRLTRISESEPEDSILDAPTPYSAPLSQDHF